MKEIQIKEPLSNEELLESLKGEFSDKYSYSLFGLGSEKSIIIRQSAFIGAQISKSEKGFSIQALMPLSVTNWFFSLLLSMYASGAMFMWMSPYKKLEKNIALFLKNKYN
ncbi:hypothetical protein [Nafulsella turpanensis]|uniref:hypothetical protein n=1 Tax=Nafulsella turpanensis TaxID=1265690 RepID=UPI0003616B3E|nr:hypothetical protein [Nafulsella turpanensis]